MTMRERIETLLDQLSEDELTAAYERLRRIVEGDRKEDQRESSGVLSRMTKDEEDAGLSWEEFRPTQTPQ